MMLVRVLLMHRLESLQHVEFLKWMFKTKLYTMRRNTLKTKHNTFYFRTSGTPNASAAIAEESHLTWRLREHHGRRWGDSIVV